MFGVNKNWRLPNCNTTPDAEQVYHDEPCRQCWQLGILDALGMLGISENGATTAWDSVAIQISTTKVGLNLNQADDPLARTIILGCLGGTRMYGLLLSSYPPCCLAIQLVDSLNSLL